MEVIFSGGPADWKKTNNDYYLKPFEMKVEKGEQ